ncbi:MAG: hypothetical protein V3R83_12330 [Gammaproteobacteria bacterium]
MTREQTLEVCVKELGWWLSDLSVSGRCNPKSTAALKMEKPHAEI